MNFNRNSSGNRKSGNAVVYNGKTFARQKDLAVHLELPEPRISKCLNEDIAINDKFIDYAIQAI